MKNLALSLDSIDDQLQTGNALKGFVKVFLN